MEGAAMNSVSLTPLLAIVGGITLTYLALRGLFGKKGLLTRSRVIAA